MMEVIIMRGISGAGKSTWAKDYLINQDERQNKRGVVISADDYRVIDGVYVFNPKDGAHDKCFQAFLTYLNERSREIIIVDNTSLTAWELAPYYRLAEINKANVRIVQIYCSVEQAYVRTEHNVPLTKLLTMYQTFVSERLPGHWNVETVLARSSYYPLSLNP